MSLICNRLPFIIMFALKYGVSGRRFNQSIFYRPQHRKSYSRSDQGLFCRLCSYEQRQCWTNCSTRIVIWCGLSLKGHRQTRSAPHCRRREQKREERRGRCLVEQLAPGARFLSVTLPDCSFSRPRWEVRQLAGCRKWRTLRASGSGSSYKWSCQE